MGRSERADRQMRVSYLLMCGVVIVALRAVVRVVKPFNAGIMGLDLADVSGPKV